MDNLCHTLVGLAIGEAGLKRRTPLGNATLMIGANIPDLDALAGFWGRTESLAFRRGWTHGVLGVAVWPFVLTGAMLAFDRLVRRRRFPARPAADPRGLLLLATVAVLTHPLLDLLNTYGVRLLMPFSGRWFYGDTLFIVDPWVWLALLVGIVLARRAARRGAAEPWRPARRALVAVGAYVAAMAVLGVLSRRAARDALRVEGIRAGRMMAGPAPLDPLRRDVVAVVDGGYTTADVYWFTARSEDGTRIWKAGAIVAEPALFERNDALPAARAAALTPAGRTFLSWARFPVFTIGPDNRCRAGWVCLSDLRYGVNGWARVAVRTRGTLSSPASPRSPEPP